MSYRDAALNLDAPVTLDELLDRNARETLEAGGRDLGVAIAVIDRDGRRIIGDPPAKAIAETSPDFEPQLVPVEGRLHCVLQLNHEGDAIGKVVVGPFADGTGVDQAMRMS